MTGRFVMWSGSYLESQDTSKGCCLYDLHRATWIYYGGHHVCGGYVTHVDLLFLVFISSDVDF